MSCPTSATIYILDIYICISMNIHTCTHMYKALFIVLYRKWEHTNHTSSAIASFTWQCVMLFHGYWHRTPLYIWIKYNIDLKTITFDCWGFCWEQTPPAPSMAHIQTCVWLPPQYSSLSLSLLKDILLGPGKWAKAGKEVIGSWHSTQQQNSGKDVALATPFLNPNWKNLFSRWYNAKTLSFLTLPSDQPALAPPRTDLPTKRESLTGRLLNTSRWG